MTGTEAIIPDWEGVSLPGVVMEESFPWDCTRLWKSCRFLSSNEAYEQNWKQPIAIPSGVEATLSGIL